MDICKENSGRFADLPLEVILCLLKRLNCYGLCMLAQCCRFFSTICQDEVTWQYFCLRDYGVVSRVEEWEVDSFMELYKNVLYQFGYLIGEWKVNYAPCGGLVSVKVVPGRIVGYLCLPPENDQITQPLRELQMFELRVKDKKCICNCLSGNSDQPHRGILYVNPPRMFTFECMHHTDHSRLEEAIKVQREILRYLECERLEWPDAINAQCLLEPGLFKGTYSTHGIELIMVDIAEGQIIGTKITGDPNVPATRVSFKADINSVVSHDELKALHSHTDEEENQNELVSISEFRLPNHFDVECDMYPIGVQARYHSLGKVAFDNYHHAQWTPTHFILFDGNLFGILWLELQCLSVYSRVKRSDFALTSFPVHGMEEQ